MGLVKCPDCGKVFSDRIDACPQCSCPTLDAMNVSSTNDNTNKENDRANSAEELNKLFFKAKEYYEGRLYDEAEKFFNTYVSEVDRLYNRRDEFLYTFNNGIELYIYSKMNENIEINSVDLHCSMAYYCLGIIKFEKQEYEEAIGILDKALLWNPIDVKILFEKAECYKALGNFEKYYTITNSTYKYIYLVEDFAHYLRNIGYYNIEKANLEIAMAAYLFSLKFERTKAAETELLYIKELSKGKVLLKNDDLEEFLNSNGIPTFVEKGIMLDIGELFISIKKSKNEESNFGRLVCFVYDSLKDRCDKIYNERIRNQETAISKSQKKKWVALLSILAIVVTGLVFAFSTIDSGKEIDSKVPLKQEEIQDNDKLNEQVISYDIKTIMIGANSSSYVGDIFSKTDTHEEYLIYNNAGGEVYKVNYKIVGGIGQTGSDVYTGEDGKLYVGEPIYGFVEDDWWYSVTLSDGREGFVWGGTNGMYVRENEF